MDASSCFVLCVLIAFCLALVVNNLPNADYSQNSKIQQIVNICTGFDVLFTDDQTPDEVRVTERFGATWCLLF